MRNINDARRAIKTPELTEPYKAKQLKILNIAYDLVDTMWETAYPSPELTTSIRKLEECLMWHGKAMANELK